MLRAGSNKEALSSCKNRALRRLRLRSSGAAAAGVRCSRPVDLVARLRSFVRRAGYDVVRFDPSQHPVAKRRALMERFGIDFVLDVGANRGQYARKLRQAGYAGRILSFEPLNAPYLDLAAAALEDPNWTTMNCGVGERDEDLEMNVSQNSYSSSALPIRPEHLAAAPDARIVQREHVSFRPLHELVERAELAGRHVLLKSDTQGYEDRVLRGAELLLPLIDTLELEMSLTPMYEGERSFIELTQTVNSYGYRFVSVEPSFWNQETGQLLQIDAVFHRFAPQSSANVDGL